MTPATRNAPHWTVAARAQLHDVRRSAQRRRLLMTFGLTFLAAALMAALDGFPAFVFSENKEIETGLRFVRPEVVDAVPGTFGIALGFLLALVIGFVWPLRVWSGNRPVEREYFWSLPMDARLHELMRVVAGLAWLQVILCGVALASLTTALVTHGTTTIAAIPLSAWLSFFAAPTALYLLNSIAALRSNLPGLWIFGLYYPVAIVLVIGSTLYRNTAVGDLSRQLLDGPLSLFVATLGPFVKVVSGTHYDVATTHWGAASALWIAVGAVGVSAAALLRKPK